MRRTQIPRRDYKTAFFNLTSLASKSSSKSSLKHRCTVTEGMGGVGMRFNKKSICAGSDGCHGNRADQFWISAGYSAGLIGLLQ